MSTEAQRSAKRRYVERHRDRVLAAKRRWNQSAKGREMRDKWQRSEKGRAWYRAEYARLRAEVVAGYGSACKCCLETEPRFLAIDHVEGGGRQERKKLGGSAFFGAIIRASFPAEYRLLCHNCNMAMGLYGFCPHRPNGFPPDAGLIPHPAPTRSPPTIRPDA